MNYQCCIKSDLLLMSWTVIVLIIRIHQEAAPLTKHLKDTNVVLAWALLFDPLGETFLTETLKPERYRPQPSPVDSLCPLNKGCPFKTGSYILCNNSWILTLLQRSVRSNTAHWRMSRHAVNLSVWNNHLAFKCTASSVCSVKRVL